jgi:hypothetical protein
MKNQVSFAEFMLNIYNLMEAKLTVKEYFKQKAASFNEPKVIALLDKYYPIYQAEIKMNFLMERITWKYFRIAYKDEDLQIQYLKEFIRIAPNENLLSSLFNQFDFTNYDPENVMSCYNIFTSKMIQFFVENGILAKYFIALGRATFLYVEQNLTDSNRDLILQIFRERMNWLFHHCKDYTEDTGMPYLAKKIAFWSMKLEDPIMLEKAFEYNPYFTDEDKETVLKDEALEPHMVNKFIKLVKKYGV